MVHGLWPNMKLFDVDEFMMHTKYGVLPGSDMGNLVLQTFVHIVPNIYCQGISVRRAAA